MIWRDPKKVLVFNVLLIQVSTGPQEQHRKRCREYNGIDQPDAMQPYLSDHHLHIIRLHVQQLPGRTDQYRGPHLSWWYWRKGCRWVLEARAIGLEAKDYPRPPLTTHHSATAGLRKLATLFNFPSLIHWYYRIQVIHDFVSMPNIHDLVLAQCIDCRAGDGYGMKSWV